ncbi:hypothetical protein IKG38_01195 [Candidatus Saccharibacteria bacterium]|nr:hypothetical protein [Candidatus Saccharibacteria bacterium]
MVANWTPQAITLPTISKTGYTCTWTYGGNSYASGASYTPTANSADSLAFTAQAAIKTNLSLKVSFDSTYVSSIKVCKTSGNCSGSDLMGTVTTSGNSVSGLTYGVAYYLYPTYTTGSVLNSWSKDSGAVGTLSSTSAANPTYTIGDGTNAVTHSGKRATYTVTLSQCSATTNGSTSATATYYSTTLSAITNPQRAYTISFANNVSGAMASSTSTLTSTYTFNGWYTGSCASPSTLVASNATTPALQASVSGYTDSSKRWTRTSAATLYAGWTGQAKTLPTITKTGYTCGWTTSSTGTTIEYASGASITPTSDLALNSVCIAKSYTITLNKNGATNTPTASTTVTYNNTTLDNIATLPTKDNTTATRTVSGFTKTTSANNSTISSTDTLNSTQTTTYTFKGWYKESGATNKIAGTGNTPTLETTSSYTTGGKWTNDGAVTLYAGWNSSAGNYSAVTLPTITRTGSTCGWSTSSDAIAITYASGASITPTGNLTLYGVCVTNVVLNGNGATTAGTTSVNVKYGVGGLSTTGGITAPQRSYSVSGWTLPSSNNANGATVNGGTAPGTLTSTYTFNGWYQEAAATHKIAGSGSTGDLLANTAYTDSNNQWNYTGTSVVTLYAGWTGGSITLPTITKTGYTCGWTTTATNATTITYASGASLTPTANTTLYGVCNIKNNLSLKVSFNSTYVSSIKVCKTSGNCSGSDLMGTVTTSGNSVSGLTYGVAYYLYPTYTTGSVLNSWAKDSGAVGTLSSTSAANPTYTIGDGTNAVTHNGKYDTYTITLNRNCSTTATGSTSATVTYLATSLSSITVPTCSNATSTRTVSGFTKTTSATNSTVSSTTTLNSTQTTTYTFNGWHLTSGTGTLIASSASTPALQQSVSGYTNASKQWTKTSGETFYAGWNASTGNYTSVTLPTITRTGSTCGWSTSSTATTITYASGSTLTPTANTTLYGVCVTNITLNANGGTGGTTSAQVIYNDTKITANNGGTSEGGNITNPTRSDTYTVSGFTKTTSANNSTVSSTTTLNSVRPYTFNGWYKETGATTQIASNATKPALTASNGYTNSSKQWTYTTAGNITLYAGWTAGSFAAVTLPTITRTGSTCGWSTSSTATTISYASGASFTPTGNTTLYGVCVNNITINKSNCPTTAGGASSATVNYNATSLNSFTAPTCSNGTASRTVSGFTKTTSATNSTVSATTTLTSSATTTYTYAGLYQQSGLTTLVANTSRALQASTTYTDANSKWTYTTASAVTLYAKFNSSTGNYSAVTLPTITRTGSTCGWSTSSTATTITYASGSTLTPTANTTLYGVCVTNITLNKNGATNSPTTSTTVNYNATTFGALATLPTKSNTTATRTVSGWTLPSSNNADGATVNGGTAPGTLNSTATVTHTFNGWHASSGTGTLIASKDSTPALQASTTYTNSSNQWTYTTAGNITLYAGWDDSTGSFSAVTLPTITKTGYTCGWTTTATNATTITYASGSSLTPTANITLYGVCNIKNNLSLKISFDSTYVSSIAVKTGSASGTTVGTVSTSGNSVTGLTYDTAYYLVPTYTTGSVLNSWAKDSGAVGTLSSTSAANPTYTIGDGTNAVTHSGKRATYTVTLKKCSATNTPTSSTTATYYSTTLGALATLPTKSSFTISGFTAPAGNNASGATVSSTTSLTATNTFNGWHIGSCASPGTLVASSASTPALQASVSGYTDSSKHWTRTSAATLYAGFTTQAKTLPTITKTGGFACGWTATSSGATDFTYASGASITPTANTTLYGVCKCPANTICYDKNATSGVEGTMGGLTITSTATSATLLASNYSRSGYGYAGWNTNAAGTGTNYGPNEDIAFTAGQYSATGLTLYTKWVASAGNIQNWNGCDSLASGAVTALTDQRDNQVYAIAKLADGQCWMIENLRLENSGTDNSNGSLAQGYGGQFAGLAAAEAAWRKGNSAANSLYYSDTQSGTATIDIGTSNPGFRFPRYNHDNTNSRASSPTANSTAMYNYGNYYTWAAAIADTTNYSSGDHGATSICPTGWRIPIGAQSTVDKSFGALSVALGGPAGGATANSSSTPTGAVMSGVFRSYPNNFVYSGLVVDQDLVDYRGSGGYYWSSTTASAYPAYRLSVVSSGVYPGTDNNFKYYGGAVRCVNNKKYIQDLTVDEVNNMAVGETLALYDKRDEEVYRVAKLADGNVWMLDNLRLGGSSAKVLTPDDTNITFNYTLPASTASIGSSYNTAKINTDYKDTTATGYGGGSKKIGTFYNYCAASAGTYCHNDDAGDGYGTINVDICPAGWRLPSGGGYGDFQTLLNNYSSTLEPTNSASLQYNLSTVQTGYYSGSSKTGSTINYWSSTPTNGTSVHKMYVDGTSVSNTTSSARYYGYSIRCVFSPEKTLSNVTYLQDVTPTIASLMTTNTTYTFKDKRDEESYKVAKLADGNVWLLDNLRLGSTSSKVLTPADTNIVEDFTLPASSTSGFTSAATSYTTAAINTSYKNTVPTVTYGAGSGKIGTYYNYCAASAGTYCLPSDFGDHSNSDYDVCPAGWRMPTGGESGEYTALRGSAGGDIRTVLSTANTGNFYDGARGNVNTGGLFWSSSWQGDNASMSFLSTTSSNLGTITYGGRRYGASVRCILKNGKTNSNKIYMQDYNKSDCGTQANKGPVEVIDKRDGYKYSVRYISDMCWMVKNLRTTGTINAEDSNFSTNASVNVSQYDLAGTGSGIQTYTLPSSHSPSYVTDNTNFSYYQAEKIGKWYNFCAASANTACSSSANVTASEDICPAGWHLIDASNILTSQMAAAYFTPDFSPMFAGSYYGSGSPQFIGERGYWWAKNGYSGTNQQGLWYQKSSSAQLSNWYKYSGVSIRCVKDVDTGMTKTMQNVDSWKEQLNIGDKTTAKDTRDDNEYTVARLADGRLWMLDNLRLGSTSSIALTSSNTNIANNYTLPAGNVTNFNSYTSAQINTTNKDAASNGWYNGAGVNKRGVYYNYCAASAGTYCSSSGTQNAVYDICPKGWRLPTNNEFNNLVSQIGASNFAQGFSVNLAGVYSGSSFYSGEVDYWTSTRSSNTAMYDLAFDIDEGIIQNDPNSRQRGQTIRCVADEEKYLHDVNKWEGELSIGDTTTAKDYRDGNEYTVARLADGKVWMVDNLKLDLVSVPYEKLVGATNAESQTLYYLKNGTGPSGETGQYATMGVKNGDSGNWVNSYDTPYIFTQNKDVIPGPMANANGSLTSGIIYNHCAASAGSYCYPLGYGSVVNTTEDICPAGWRMPTGGATGDFGALYTAYSSNVDNFRNNAGLVLSGYMGSGTGITNVNTGGYYWTSSLLSDTAKRKAMYVYQGSVNFTDGSSDNRYWGYAVRCVKK